MLRIFIGYDPREAVAYNVLQYSIIARSSAPLSITPIMLRSVSKVFNRKRDPLQSTDFSFSRFLTPYLSDYSGWSLFLDSDMLVLGDITELFSLANDKYSVMVVKHDHRPNETVKFLGEKQTQYEKKNWSSVILFHNEKCKALTPEYVNSATGLELHQFKWFNNDEVIGELPRRWNHLVGYDAPNKDASLVHYTLGGPYFKEFENCEYSHEWFLEKERMLHAGIN